MLLKVSLAREKRRANQIPCKFHFSAFDVIMKKVYDRRRAFARNAELFFIADVGTRVDPLIYLLLIIRHPHWPRFDVERVPRFDFCSRSPNFSEKPCSQPHEYMKFSKSSLQSIS